MNKLTRNLTLPAAALAALLLAPTSEAHGLGRGRGATRGDTTAGTRNAARRRGPAWRGPYAWRRGTSPATRYVAHGTARPTVSTSGFRFYSAYPGPGYVYIAGYGWVLPPFFGAVWVPGHYDIGGFWVEGFWR